MFRRNSSLRCIQWAARTFISDNPWTQGTDHCSGLRPRWTLSCHLLEHGQPHLLLAGKRRCYRVLTSVAWSTFAGGGSLLTCTPRPPCDRPPFLQRTSSVVACCWWASCRRGVCWALSSAEGGGPPWQGFQSEGDTVKKQLQSWGSLGARLRAGFTEAGPPELRPGDAGEGPGLQAGRGACSGRRRGLERSATGLAGFGQGSGHLCSGCQLTQGIQTIGHGVWGESSPVLTSCSRLCYPIFIYVLNFAHGALHPQAVKTFSKTWVPLTGSTQGYLCSMMIKMNIN